jgi:hypothetical protein
LSKKKLKKNINLEIDKIKTLISLRRVKKNKILVEINKKIIKSKILIKIKIFIQKKLTKKKMMNNK